MRGVSDVDHVLASALGRLAVETGLVQRAGRPAAANLLRECVEQIGRMADQCQLQEFTEHGLSHIASLVDRIDSWTTSRGASLVNALTNDEAFLLLLAVITHDIGMLSQRESDLPEEARTHFAMVFADLPVWVRRTHVHRIEAILRRTLGQRYRDFVDSPIFELCCSLARSHQAWPDEQPYQDLRDCASRLRLDPQRMAALAGVLAVADLLDEDSSRCDSMTLFANKAGTLLNRAHWLRHMLVANRLEAVRGLVWVQLSVPANLEGRIQGALAGLRNHLRLCQRYNPVLAPLDAQVSLQFLPPTVCESVPEEPALALLLCEPDTHLLRTFWDCGLPEATPEAPVGTLVNVNGVELQTIDLTYYHLAVGPLGDKSGRSDHEVTYVAAAARDEAARSLAVRALRQGAWEANGRGDVKAVRRLASVVIPDLLGAQGPTALEDALWAAVLTLHWASREADLLSVRRLVERMLDGTNGEQLAAIRHDLPVEWQLVALTSSLLEGRPLPSWDRVIGLMSARLEGEQVAPSREEWLAWHDLVEALWGSGWLAGCPAGFWEHFERLHSLEHSQCPVCDRPLSELAWRMAVQSYCLSGYGRWEAPTLSREPQHYGLPDDPGRTAMANLWVTWYHGCSNEQARAAARAARQSNPTGSELYVPALEAEWFISSCDLASRLTDDDATYRLNELLEVQDRDPAYQLITSAVTALLDTVVEPKREDTVYFPSRPVNLWRTLSGPTVLLAERLALRRWYLASWQRVVGAAVQATLARAYTMLLEGEEVADVLPDALVALAWAGPYAGKSQKLLEFLWPQAEPRYDQGRLTDVAARLRLSPPRVANINHPGIKVLGDALAEEMLPDLIEWTRSAVGDPAQRPSPEKLGVWGDLLQYVDLSPDAWRAMESFFFYCIGLPEVGAAKRVIGAVLNRAPWAVAGPVLGWIVDRLRSEGGEERWAAVAKRIAVNALLGRADDQWRHARETRGLVDVLRGTPRAPRADPEDALMADLLDGPVQQDGCPRMARHLLATLESIRDRACSRRPGDAYSFNLGGCLLGPLPPADEQVCRRVARLMHDLWDAQAPTWEEIGLACDIIGHFFGAATEPGRHVLANAFLRAMGRPRVAIALDGMRDQSVALWDVVAQHSALVPHPFLGDLHSVIVRRFTELPAEAVWAQGRLVTDVLLRSDVSEERASSRGLLLAVWSRAVGKLRARAFLGVARRLLEADDWPQQVRPVLRLVADWAEEAAGVPDAGLRAAVAEACRHLVGRLEGDARDHIHSVLVRLRGDVRLRVRTAAGPFEPGDVPGGS